ncbi:ABC transporter substrate-binding protein [Microvirga pakistanensis]|uniref:ABC transporter substrate-binding protein n=1 Tax=Microvirga pakistanensis TaxID=1682650 RepID=UPI00141A6F71|nr:sugar ABC transporter substrate-binding protein [Microvirga pakistanensis]
MEQLKTAMGLLSRRKTMLLGAAALAMQGLAGSHVAAQESGGGLGTADSPVQLRIIADAAYGNAWQQVMVPKFNEKYPHIKVTIDPVPYTELLAKAMLDATASTPTYDILVLDDPWTPQVAQTGALVDLRKETAQWTNEGYDWDDFNAAPLAATQWKGVQYGVPMRSNMLLMFVNKTLYKKAGLPVPTPDLTWKEYLEQAPKLVQDTNGDGVVDAWAIGTYFKRDPLTPTIWQSILNSEGGRLLDNAGKPAFNDEIGVKALETHVELLKYAPPGAISHGYSEALAAFRQGQVATSFMWGSVYRNSAVDPKTTTLTPEQVGLQVLPVGAKMGGSNRGIASGTIHAKSKKKEAAWAFLQWFSSKEGELYHVNNLGGFPARKSTLATKPNADNEWMTPVFAALQQGFDVIEAGEMWRVRHPKSDAVQQALADAVASAISGQASAKAALDDAARRAERALR